MVIFTSIYMEKGQKANKKHIYKGKYGLDALSIL